jgi:putative transposase
VLTKYIFKDIDQVRKQIQLWIDDYNYHRPDDSLDKISPIEYAKLNSFGVSPKRIKNNKTIELLEK